MENLPRIPGYEYWTYKYRLGEEGKDFELEGEFLEYKLVKVPRHEDLLELSIGEIPRGPGATVRWES